MLRNDKGFSERAPQPFRNGQSYVGVSDLGHDQHEFIASDAGKCISLAYASTQAFSDALEQYVANLVAQGFIHELKAVQIHTDQSSPEATVPGMVDGLLQAIRQQQTVWKSCEIVMPRLMRQFALHLLSTGDILHDHSHARWLSGRIPN